MTVPSEVSVELVYFDGCPHTEAARGSLRAALGSGGWTEWNLSDPGTPARYRRHGSPTVLVGGRDVRGEGGAVDALACRADGAPGPDEIRRALEARRPRG